MADRRPLNPGVVVPKPGGGTQPRDRNNDGRFEKNARMPGSHANNDKPPQGGLIRHTVFSNRCLSHQ